MYFSLIYRLIVRLYNGKLKQGKKILDTMEWEHTISTFNSCWVKIKKTLSVYSIPLKDMYLSNMARLEPTRNCDLQNMNHLLLSKSWDVILLTVSKLYYCLLYFSSNKKKSHYFHPEKHKKCSKYRLLYFYQNNYYSFTNLFLLPNLYLERKT